MNIRFTTKVLIVTVVPVVTTAILLASILISGRIDEFNARIEEKGQNLADYLAPISEYGVFSNNFNYMRSTLERAIKVPDIAAVYVLDKDKNILTQMINPAWAHIQLSDNDPSFLVFQSGIIKTETHIDDIDTYSSEYTTQSKIGTVQLYMSLSRSAASKHKIIKDGLFVTLISTIVTILVALIFSRSVTRPVTLIKNGVSSIKSGNLHHRISLESKGEIAELANDINDMTASLEVAQIKEKQRAEDALFIEKTKAQITLEAIGEGVITTDINGLITYINPAAQHLTGFALAQALNQPLSHIFKIKEYGKDVIIDYPIKTCINEAVKIHHESDYILIREDKTEYAIRETATPLVDKNNKVIGAVLVFHDFTSIKKMSDALSYQATHDDLTGLLNRRAFENRLNMIIDDMQPSNCHSLCYIDLDQFKIVNDTSGHVAGDNLLKVVARRISDQIRKNDLFARLGGDEFGLVLFDCDIEKATVLAEKIRDSIANLVFSWDAHTFKIGCSIGVVPIMYDSTMTEMLVAADTACYIAKDSGRNRMHIYNTEDDVVSRKQGELQWLQRLNRALENNAFELYTQKIVTHSDSSDTEMHEILIRLNDHDEIISPGVFIPVAERYQMMSKIDRWVLKSLFQMASQLNSISLKHFFTINLSGQSITDESFSQFLTDQLDNSDFPAEKLIFEITETSAISNFIDAVEFIRTFKAKGCQFALDDFGSGMCSFQYLNELPVDYLKIDGGFVKAINENPFNKSIIQSISQIGHSLDLKIIAEFVESQAILDVLDKTQIDFVQGYAIDYPQPISRLFD